MEKTLIATNVIDRPTRISGIYQAAWRVTIGDITGTAVHTFEWDGRDIENETLMASPEIAKALEAEISECGFPDPGSCGFCDTGEREDGKHDAMDAAIDEATVIVYDAN
jgi:hypothetical protein